jgi:hypothetical protein
MEFAARDLAETEAFARSRRDRKMLFAHLRRRE